MRVSGSFTVIDEEEGGYLAVLAGVKLPTGATGQTNPAGARAEVTVQPWSGSLDFFGGVAAEWGLAKIKSLDDLYSQVR